METSELLQIMVKDVMTTQLITVHQNDVLSKADSLLSLHSINHLPVVDDDYNLKGILTKNDLQLVKDWGTNLNLKSSIEANYKLLNSNVAADKMNAELVVVSSDDTLGMCADIFKNNLFHALPVTEGTKLVGIITTFDLLKVAYS